MKKRFESAKKPLTLRFLDKCDTPMPKSTGFAYRDYCMDNDWSPIEPSRDNDCYTQFDYNLYPAEEELPGGVTFAEIEETLRLFIESSYHDNDKGS